MVDVSQGKVTGIIIPPPDIRAVVDKTAQFVARNGKSFEERILNSSEGKTAKFNFMKSLDPYHAYYEQKIMEFENGINGTATTTSAASTAAAAGTSNAMDVDKSATIAPSTTAALVKASITTPIAQFAMNKTTCAPYRYEFILAHPVDTPAYDIDVIKLTAKYTAYNGKEFLAGIAQRETRNRLFDFLKPTHILFSYFTALVESYSKIINPPEDGAIRGRIDRFTDKMKVLETAVQRWDWNNQEAEKKKSREKSDSSKLQTIDWSDFVVVEVIDFNDDELLEMPSLVGLDVSDSTSTISSNNNSSSSSSHMEISVVNNVDTNDSNDIEPMPSISRGQQRLQGLQRIQADENDDDDDDDLHVVSEYIPRTSTNVNSGAMQLTTIDPISGREININDMSEHMKVQLIDPKWRIQHQRFQDKQKETGYAEGGSIADSLKIFAKKRSDIFGQSDGNNNSNSNSNSSTSGGGLGKDGVEHADKKLKHSDNTGEAGLQLSQIMESRLYTNQVQHTGIPQPALYQMPHPQQHIIHPSVAIPPPFNLRPMGLQHAGHMGLPPPVPMGLPPQPMYPPINPNNIKSITPANTVEVATTLISAEEFSLMYPGPIQLYVKVPSDTSNSSWQLNGQTIAIQLNKVTMTVKESKELVSSMLGDIPGNKYQLKHASVGFLKDPASYAELNIGHDSVIEIAMKTRGGRR